MLHSLGTITTLATNFEILASNINIPGLINDVGAARNSLLGALGAAIELMLFFIFLIICLITLLLHLICTIVFLRRNKYLQQEPGIFNRLA